MMKVKMIPDGSRIILISENTDFFSDLDAGDADEGMKEIGSWDQYLFENCVSNDVIDMT